MLWDEDAEALIFTQDVDGLSTLLQGQTVLLSGAFNNNVTVSGSFTVLEEAGARRLKVAEQHLATHFVAPITIDLHDDLELRTDAAGRSFTFSAAVPALTRLKGGFRLRMEGAGLGTTYTLASDATATSLVRRSIAGVERVARYPAATGEACASSFCLSPGQLLPPAPPCDRADRDGRAGRRPERCIRRAAARAHLRQRNHLHHALERLLR